MNFYGDAIETFPFLPEQSSYTYNIGSSVVSVELDGGKSKSRKDVEGNTSIVNCEWVLNDQEYEYFIAFYNAIGNEGASSFKMPLLLDGSEVEEYNCKFVPNSVTLNSPSGLSYLVSAQIEVEPNSQNANPFVNLIKLRTELSTGNSLFENLSILVNENLAEI